MPDVAVGFGDAHNVVVGSIPYGARLVGHCRVDLILLVGVEGGAEGDYLGEYGHVIVADAVAGFVPPVIGGNVKPVDGYRTVHHKADLLFRSKE